MHALYIVSCIHNAYTTMVTSSTPPRPFRLQDLVQGVYGERARLRKHMADLDASEREALLKVCRKVSFRESVFLKVIPLPLTLQWNH